MSWMHNEEILGEFDTQKIFSKQDWKVGNNESSTERTLHQLMAPQQLVDVVR